MIHSNNCHQLLDYDRFIQPPPKQSLERKRLTVDMQQHPSEPASKRQKVRRHRVQWTSQPEICQSPPQDENFDPNEIWYTREDYDFFLKDRLRTVSFLRASGGDDGLLDHQNDCLRGLEPFQTEIQHQHLYSMRRVHQRTVLLEQIRQARLGNRDPERFRLLVASQSEAALRRAQQLAALDEDEVYRKVQRRSSAPSAFEIMRMNESSRLAQNNVDESLASLTAQMLSEKILLLQQMNARRLMELYNPSSNGVPFPQQLPLRRESLFGSTIRRDSLFGNTTTNNSFMGNNNMLGGIQAIRFPIRRDSLSCLNQGHS